MVSDKESTVSECYVVRDGSIVWGVSFRTSLCVLEEARYGDLLGILSNIFLCRDS